MADAGWVREYQDGDVVPGTSYRVVRLMGTGGMGSVYEVEHVEIGRRYVLKQLLKTLASREDLVHRMEKEWRALGVLRHPNIVDIVYAGRTADGIPYYVMELLVGETVRERLEHEGKISPGQAARIAQQTLLGLAAAHAVGVVHRDIKPANIFLTSDGAVKVLDFGISYSESVRKITLEGHAIGTPRYMSPEQASGEKADARSDLYAVGLLLFEMLAGEGPFDDLSEITQQMLAHLHRPPRPLTRFADVPAGLDAIVTRALAKNPSERSRSAEYMAAELAPFATAPPGQPVSTPLPSPRTSIPSAEWQQPTQELRSTRSTPSPITTPTRPAPLLTKGTTIGAAALAAAIPLVAYLILSRPDTPATSVPMPSPSRSPSTSMSPSPSPSPSTSTSTSTSPSPSPSTSTSTPAIADSPSPALSPSSAPASPPAPPPALDPSAKPAPSAHKSKPEPPPSDSFRLPPSGL